MHPQVMLRFLLALVVASVLWAGSAAATPVTHSIVGNNFTADIAATLDIEVNTNLGTVNGDASGSGMLGSTPSGSIDFDWGDPNWDNQFNVAAGDANIDLNNPGSVNGGATLDLFGFIPVNFDLQIDVDNIGLNLASAFSATPIPSESTPGTGPWTGLDPAVDLLLGAQIDFSATGPFGINIGTDDIVIGPTTVDDVPLPLTLERLGVTPGNPEGTGTQTSLTIPAGLLELSFGGLPPTTVDTPGCEQTVPGTSTCALNVESVTVQLTSLDLTNIAGSIVAEQFGTTIPVPEPSTLAMLGSGLGGLLLLGGRLGRRRRD